MKRLFVLAVVAFVSITGCQHTSNSIGTAFNPLIGTWTANSIGVKTEIIFNADKTTTETVTILGVATTKNGKWDSNGTTVFRTWSSESADSHYYSFSSKSKKLTLSDSSAGISVTYERS